MHVRILKDWRGLAAGIFADVRGQHLADGLSDGALDDKVKPTDVPDAKTHPDVIGEDAKKSAKP